MSLVRIAEAVYQIMYIIISGVNNTVPKILIANQPGEFFGRNPDIFSENPFKPAFAYTSFAGQLLYA